MTTRYIQTSVSQKEYDEIAEAVYKERTTIGALVARATLLYIRSQKTRLREKKANEK